MPLLIIFALLLMTGGVIFKVSEHRAEAYHLSVSGSYHESQVAGLVEGVAIGDRISVLGLSLAPVAVVSGNECAAHGACGVLTKIDDGERSLEHVFEVGKPMPYDEKIIMLTQLAPIAQTGEYRFNFNIISQ